MPQIDDYLKYAEKLLTLYIQFRKN